MDEVSVTMTRNDWLRLRSTLLCGAIDSRLAAEVEVDAKRAAVILRNRADLLRFRTRIIQQVWPELLDGEED